MKSRIRIGKINYTNVWPIFHHFPYERFDNELDVIEKVPSELNRALQSGSIDLAAISSFAYGASCDDYVLFPDLSVSASARARSLLLFHRRPLEDIAGGTFALTTASATTVHLLKIIMKKFYGGEPIYRSVAPELDAMMQDADAALLIGDDAIRASWSNEKYLVTDLGELWKLHTGHGMTFAVWAVRKQTALRQPELVGRIFEAFQASKRRSQAEPGPVVREAVVRIGGTPSYWQDYFAGLCYDFGPEQWAGLSLYFQYAQELGLLERPAPIQIWNDKSSLQVKE